VDQPLAESWSTQEVVERWHHPSGMVGAGQGLQDTLLQLDRTSGACRAGLRARRSALSARHSSLSAPVPELISFPCPYPSSVPGKKRLANASPWAEALWIPQTAPSSAPLHADLAARKRGARAPDTKLGLSGCSFEPALKRWLSILFTIQ